MTVLSLSDTVKLSLGDTIEKGPRDRHDAHPAIISAEDFFSPPERAGATISPDGTRLAYLARGATASTWGCRTWTADELRTPLRHRRRDAQRVLLSWTYDSRWLLYMQDSGGDEHWHVYRVDPEAPGTPAVDLTRSPVRASYELLKACPGRRFVQYNARNAELVDAYELDIATGELTLLAENPGTVVNWIAGPAVTCSPTPSLAEGVVEISQWDSATGRCARSGCTRAGTIPWASTTSPSPLMAPASAKASARRDLALPLSASMFWRGVWRGTPDADLVLA